MRTEDRAVNPMKALLALLVNGMFGIFVGLGLLLVCAVLVWCEWVGESMLTVFPYVCAFFGSLVSAFSSGKMLGRGFLIGLLQTIIQFTLMYLLGLLVFVRLVPSHLSLYPFLSCLIGGTAGGMLSAARIRKYKRIR